MAIVVNNDTSKELRAQSRGLASPGNPGKPFTRTYVGPVMFAVDVAAGAKAKDAVLLDASLVANLRSVVLNRFLAYVGNDPQLVARIYAYRIRLGPDSTGVYPTEPAKTQLLENVVLVTGPEGSLKFSQPNGDGVGDIFPGQQTTVNNTNRSGRMPRWQAVAGGADYVFFNGDFVELRAGFAFTAEASRLELELWGEWARYGDVDWSRDDCVPTPERMAQYAQFVRGAACLDLCGG